MSPASGDLRKPREDLDSQQKIVSIQLMSPASGDILAEYGVITYKCGFHSINVPSEWGHHESVEQIIEDLVSIQLMSPASGDLLCLFCQPAFYPFPFN